MGTIGLGLLVLAMLQTDLPAKPGPTTGATMNRKQTPLTILLQRMIAKPQPGTKTLAEVLTKMVQR